MSDIPDTWLKSGSLEELGDLYEQIEGENSDLREQLTRLRAQQTVLRDALKRIATPHGCGCKPCTGQCRSQEALAITVDEFRDCAIVALATLDVPDPKELT